MLNPKINDHEKINSNQFKSIKKVFFLLVAVLLFTEVQAQIKVDSDGTVFVGPGYGMETIEFFVDGVGERSLAPDNGESGSVGKANRRFYDMWAWEFNGYFFNDLSDRRMKENIKDIDAAMDKIKSLKGQKYDFKLMNRDSIKNETKLAKMEKARKNHLGFIAQDVLDIVPEAVKYDEESDTYFLNYSTFIPLIVEAMKEQQATIEALGARIAKLEGNPKSKSANVGNSTGSNEPDMMNTITLGQNIPNPFSDNTRIDIFLPETVKNAGLYVYNMQGAQIKSFEIQERGNTAVIIEGYTLNPGMYLYSLIADGQLIDTKKMVVTD